jgi:hypothetical protein
MPYPEEAEGFQVDSPDTWTQFNKRFVRHSSYAMRRIVLIDCGVVPVEAVRRLWYARSSPQYRLG